MILYAGTAKPGRVYRYDGGTTWTLISGTMGDAVFCLTVYNGRLYAGVTVDHSIGYVYRYLGGTNWEQVGGSLGVGVLSLVVHNGELFAGVGGPVYEGFWLELRTIVFKLVGNSWVNVYDFVEPHPPPMFAGAHHFHGTSALLSKEGDLYHGDYQYGGIWRNSDYVFDPHQAWISQPGAPENLDIGLRGIRNFTQHNNTIYAAHRYRYIYSDNGIDWSIEDLPWDFIGVHGSEQFASFQGDLYKARDKSLFKNHNEIWTLPGAWYHGVQSFANDGDGLYIGLGEVAEAPGPGHSNGSGEVYAYTGSGEPQLISGVMDKSVKSLYVHTGFNIWVKKSSAWLQVTDVWTKKGGVWQAVTDVSTRKGGRWNPV